MTYNINQSELDLIFRMGRRIPNSSFRIHAKRQQADLRVAQSLERKGILKNVGNDDEYQFFIRN